MKSRECTKILLYCLASLVLCGGTLHAQVRAPVKGADESGRGREVKIKKLWPVVSVKTPVFQSSYSAGRKPPQEWSEIRVEYDTAPEWIDELTFQFYVMTRTKVDGQDAFSFFKTTVRHIDVEKGKSHFALAYLPPAAVKRYGSVVAVAAEISKGGELQETKSLELIKLPENWWSNPAVTESKSMTVRDGYLMGRSLTPFALINIDDNEVSR